MVPVLNCSHLDLKSDINTGVWLTELFSISHQCFLYSEVGMGWLQGMIKEVWSLRPIWPAFMLFVINLKWLAGLLSFIKFSPLGHRPLDQWQPSHGSRPDQWTFLHGRPLEERDFSSKVTSSKRPSLIASSSGTAPAPPRNHLLWHHPVVLSPVVVSNHTIGCSLLTYWSLCLPQLGVQPQEDGSLSG